MAQAQPKRPHTHISHPPGVYMHRLQDTEAPGQERTQLGGELTPLTSFGGTTGIGAARDGKGSALTRRSPGPTHPGPRARRGLASARGVGLNPGQKWGSAPLIAPTSPRTPPAVRATDLL